MPKEIKPSGAATIFPVVAGAPSQPAAHTIVPQHPEGMTDFLNEMAKRRAVDEELKRMWGYKPDATVAPPTPEVREKDKAKRYLVDTDTGDILPDDEGGELSYTQALLASKAIKTKRNETPETSTTLAIVREVGGLLKPEAPATPPPVPRIYDVEEDGTIVIDRESGEYTLAEAKAIAHSRARALTSQPEILSKEGMELRLRDFKDDMLTSMKAIMTDTRPVVTAPEEPFSIGQDGEIGLNPKAKLGPIEVLAWQFLQARNRDSDRFRDEGGMVWKDTPTWLEAQRWRGEERRKDEMHAAVVETISEVKKGARYMVGAFKELTTDKPPEKTLQGTDWEKKEEQAGRKMTDMVRSAQCSACGGEILMMEGTVIATCPKCSTANFYGTDEQAGSLGGALLRKAGRRWRDQAGQESAAESEEQPPDSEKNRTSSRQRSTEPS